MRIKKINILGVKISAINMETTCEIIERWIKEGRKRYVCVTGVHGITEAQRDKNLINILNSAGVNVPDGKPLSLIGRLLGYKEMERVYGPDLMLSICELSAEKGYTNYLYGGTRGVAERLKSVLVRQFPGLNVVGIYCPPFRSLTVDEEEELKEVVEKLSPDIFWVGISTPRQEKWMFDHINKLNIRVMIGVGAAFDFLSGTKKQAPKWMQESSLEWLFRLSQEPGRLWYRYLVNNPLFVLNLALQWIGLKKFKG